MKVKNRKHGVCYILDNGAHTAKIGTSISKIPEIIPNCIMKVKSERRRPFIGDQINECRDASGLFYLLPFQKGYLVNWDIQKSVWDYIFSKEICSARLSETPLCITEPMFNFQSNQEAMDEIFFEEYDSCAILRVNPTDLAAYNYCKSHMTKDLIVIDSGYSFTHIVPYIDGVKYLPAVRRIDIGGKMLTNHLKEIVSYRQLHVMDETYVVNQIKEDACFVSTDFRIEMQQSSYRDKRNKIIREYVLPDYSILKRGYLRPYFKTDDEKFNAETNNKHNATNNHYYPPPLENLINPNNQTAIPFDQQVIILNNERISVPEILFHPSDIGIEQKGVAEAVIECIENCPPEKKFTLFGNIVITGGSTLFPNFQNRLYCEIRSRADERITVQVTSPKNPIVFPWYGGKILTNDEYFSTIAVSKEDYEEFGHNYAKEHREPFRVIDKFQ